jgi:hypothetical protein
LRRIVDQLIVMATQAAIVGIVIAGASDGMRW